MKLIIATTALVLTAGTVFAQDADVEMPEFAKPEIAFVDAAAIASKAAVGDLIAMELDYTETADPVYLADLESDTGLARLMIDGDTGAVLVSEIISAKTEDMLGAYLENFGTHADVAEMALLTELIEDALDDHDLDPEDLDLTEDDLPEHHDMTGEDVAPSND